jgi:transposase
MRFVPVKTTEQQAALLVHRGRERLVRQRTALVNALRAHLAEFGVIAPLGRRNVARLIAIVRDESDARLPDLAREVLRVRRAGRRTAGGCCGDGRATTAWHRATPAAAGVYSVRVSVPRSRCTNG